MASRTKFSLLQQLNELQNMASVMHEVYRAKAFRHAYVEVLKVKSLNKSELMNLDVGTRMKEKFSEFLAKGKISETETKKQDPTYKAAAGLHGLLGVGHRMIEKWSESGINDIKSLKNAVKSGDVKLNHIQTLGLKYHDDLNTKIPRKTIDDLVKSLNDDLKDVTEKMEAAGSYRRGKKESGDIDIVIVCNDIDAVIKRIKSRPDYIDTVVSGNERFTWLCKGSHGLIMQVDILNVPEKSWVYAMLYFTGSVYFNEYMRGAARSAGLKLNQHGLYHDGIPIACDTEEKIFEKIGIKFVPYDRR
jgi:DNA polymerase IV